MPSAVAINKKNKLTLKQEQFAQLVASGLDQAAAYRQVYNVGANTQPNTIYNSASLLCDKPKISQRIAELRKDFAKTQALTSRDEQLEKMLQLQSIAATHLQKTRITLDADGNETEEATFNRSAADTIIKCAEVINKMCGYNEPDKVDTTLKIEFVRPQALQGADGDNDDNMDNMIEIDDYEDLSE